MTLNGWTRWVPGLRTLEHYQLAWLPHDFIAGRVVTTMLVPMGIAYTVTLGPWSDEFRGRLLARLPDQSIVENAAGRGQAPKVDARSWFCWLKIP